MAATQRIPDEVLTVLSDAVADGCVIKLRGQLERKLYEKADKVLKGLGGKWNKKYGGHLFDYDPLDALENALLTGEFTNEKIQYQFFPTPEPVGRLLVSEADLHQSGIRILEPSVGEGHLARVIKHNMLPSAELETVEINHKYAEKAALNLNLGVTIADFLRYRQLPGFQPFDRIIANPPFTRKQDIDHVLEMWKCLAPGGRLVSVMSLSVLFANDSKTVGFREFVESEGGEFHRLAEGAFKESGTNVKACYLVIDKDA